MLKRNTKAQSVVEYALMLSVVYLAIAGMNLYLKRGIQAKVKDLTTNLIAKDLYGRPMGETHMHQFVAGNARSNSNIETVNTQSRQTTGNITEVDLRENTTRTGQEISVPEGWEDILPNFNTTSQEWDNG